MLTDKLHGLKNVMRILPLNILLSLLFLDLYCLVNSYGVCYDMHYTSYSQNTHTLQFGVKVLNYFLWAKNEQNVFGQNITTNKKIG